jgi:tRNA-2-methylthio-N6-dimethylallyladenosine synthase
METYGCQMNKAESESILIALTDAGWAEGSSEDADLVILNTCSVRETAEERIRGRLGYYRHQKLRRPLTLVLTGCMAERLKESVLDEHPEVDVVVGTFSKRELLAAVRSSEERGEPVVAAAREGYAFAQMHSSRGLKAFVPIMHGCDNWCTYCIVPSVRGREVSRSPGEIIAEVAALGNRGVKEITLLGQNVNSYHWQAEGQDIAFPDLLRLVEREAGSVRWLRFLTSHPKDLSEELLRVMAGSGILCRHVHLPLQSGSSRVLARMNRGYTTEQYRRKVQAIRSALSGASITTDILIGFPGETEGDFAETLAMMQEIGFEDAFTYHYNPREGTPAFAMPDAIPSEVKMERLARVIDAQRSIGARKASERIGREVEVLVEGISKKNAGELLARSEWDAMVVFAGGSERIGSFARVRLASLSGNTFRAEVLS